MIIKKIGMDIYILVALLKLTTAIDYAGLANEAYASDDESCDRNKVYTAEKAACSFDGVLCCWYNKGGTQFGKWSLSNSTLTPEVQIPEGPGFLLLRKIGMKDSITGIIWSPNFTLPVEYDVMSFEVYCGNGGELEVHVMYLEDDAENRGELLPDNEEEICEEETADRWMKRYFKMQKNDEWISTEGIILTLVLHGTVENEPLAVRDIKFYTNGTVASTKSTTPDTTTLETTTEDSNVTSTYESTTMNQSSSTVTNGTITGTGSTTSTENTDEINTITDDILCTTINTTYVSNTTTTITETDGDTITEAETTTSPTTTTTETATNSTCLETKTTTTSITSSETASSIDSNKTATPTSVSTDETTVTVSENGTGSTVSETNTTISRSTEITSTVTTSVNGTESTQSETSSVSSTEIDTTTQTREETSTVTASENVTTNTYSETQSTLSDSATTHDTSTLIIDDTTEHMQLHSSMETWEEALLGTFVLFCVFALSLFFFNFLKKLYGRRKLWVLRKGNLDPIFPDEGPGVIKMKVFAHKSPEV